MTLTTIQSNRRANLLAQRNAELKEPGGTCHGEFVADLYERCNVWEEGRLRYDML